MTCYSWAPVAVNRSPSQGRMLMLRRCGAKGWGATRWGGCGFCFSWAGSFPLGSSAHLWRFGAPASPSLYLNPVLTAPSPYLSPAPAPAAPARSPRCPLPAVSPSPRWAQPPSRSPPLPAVSHDSRGWRRRREAPPMRSDGPPQPVTTFPPRCSPPWIRRRRRCTPWWPCRRGAEGRGAGRAGGCVRRGAGWRWGGGGRAGAGRTILGSVRSASPLSLGCRHGSQRRPARKRGIWSQINK